MINRVTLSLILGCFCLVGYACSGTTPEATKPGANSNAPATPPPAAPAAPLAALSAYGVEWISNQIPSEMQANKQYTVTITIKNPTSATWPARGTGPGSVTIAYHWLPAQGEKAVVFDGERTALPHDIAPGESITLNNVLVVPPPGPGVYRLQMTLVHESISWFEGAGAKPLTLPVTVR
jgi:hypothetical protein